jgi:cathepsin B
MVQTYLLLALPLLVLSGPALRLQDEMPVVTADMVQEINASGDWQASMEWVEGMTIGQAKKMMGGLKGHMGEFPEFKLNALANYLTTPASYTWVGNSCIGAIRNQADCGSCWAFGAVEAFADRICLKTNAKTQVVLSPQWLVSCDTDGNKGCGGGFQTLAWSYINKHGIPAESCDPYTSGDNDETGSCSANCSQFYKSTTPTAYKGPDNIKAGILTGPVETCFEVYQDFMSYKSGVYIHKTGAYVGNHCVKMLGWGVQSGTSYWIIANSWGTTWGMDGIFYIAFGQGGIDTEAMAGDYASS